MKTNKRALIYYILNAIVLITSLLLFFCSCTRKGVSEPTKKIKPVPAPDRPRHGETFEITKHTKL